MFGFDKIRKQNIDFKEEAEFSSPVWWRSTRHHVKPFAVQLRLDERM